MIPFNPHIKYYEGDRRGYFKATVTPERMTRRSALRDERREPEWRSAMRKDRGSSKTASPALFLARPEARRVPGDDLGSPPGHLTRYSPSVSES